MRIFTKPGSDLWENAIYAAVRAKCGSEGSEDRASAIAEEFTQAYMQALANVVTEYDLWQDVAEDAEISPDMDVMVLADSDEMADADEKFGAGRTLQGAVAEDC